MLDSWLYTEHVWYSRAAPNPHCRSSPPGRSPHTRQDPQMPNSLARVPVLVRGDAASAAPRAARLLPGKLHGRCGQSRYAR
eukprot:6190984-Pleurochrysis_carterae.AAC.6